MESLDIRRVLKSDRTKWLFSESVSIIESAIRMQISIGPN